MYEYQATLVSVTDGDTVRLDIDLGFNVILHNMPIRLIGIDAPDARNPEGLVAKTYMKELLPVGTAITLISYKDKTEKYGRILGIVIISETSMNVNQEMVNKGHAVPYLTTRS